MRPFQLSIDQPANKVLSLALLRQLPALFNPGTTWADRSALLGRNSYPHPVAPAGRLMKCSCLLMGRIDKYMASWRMFSDCPILRTMHAAFQVNNTTKACLGNAWSVDFIAVICVGKTCAFMHTGLLHIRKLLLYV